MGTPSKLWAGATESGKVPEAARQAAAVGPWFLLGVGAVCGGVSLLFNRPIGMMVLTVCLGPALVLAVAADRVRRLTRWTSGAAVAGAAAFCGGPFAAGVAIATTRFDARTMWIALAACALAAVVIWRRALRLRGAQWDANRVVNEGEVLDVATATYDVGRNFVYESPTAARTAPLDRALPLVAFAATLAAGLSQGQDLRPLLVIAVAPVVLLGFLPALAAGVVTFRKIREYERRTGRTIVNR